MTRNERRQHWKTVIPIESVPKFQVRTCRDCGEKKPCRWNACFDVHGKPEYKTRCTACQPKWESKHRKANRPQYAKNARRRKFKIKLRCIEYLGGCCFRCGYSRSSRALTFHHNDREAKEYSISQIKDRAWMIIQAELDKCILVCFNCHMEIEEEHDRAKD